MKKKKIPFSNKHFSTAGKAPIVTVGNKNLI